MKKLTGKFRNGRKNEKSSPERTRLGRKLKLGEEKKSANFMLLCRMKIPR